MWRRERFILELDSAADPIAGSIGPAEGPMLDFAGYVELIAALERARTESRARDLDQQSNPADEEGGGR